MIDDRDPKQATRSNSDQMIANSTHVNLHLRLTTRHRAQVFAAVAIFAVLPARLDLESNLLSVSTRMERDTRADTLEARLVQFAIDVVKLVGDLPQNFQARHIAGQLLRSGTAAAPNYGEARAAESRADFIHKIRIALKELNETAVWLRIVRGSFAMDPDSPAKLVAENAELCRILVASIQTATE